MHDPDELRDVIARLDRLAGVNLQQEQDRVQVQGKLHAHLIQRGQQVAQDMDLGHVHDHDLATLGELTVIGENPTVDPGLATHLDMIASNLAGHPRPTTGCRGCDIGTHTHWPCTKTAPEALPQIVPERSDYEVDAGLGLGRGGHAARGEPETAVQNGKFDRKRYWDELVKDRPDDEWSPS